MNELTTNDMATADSTVENNEPVKVDNELTTTSGWTIDGVKTTNLSKPNQWFQWVSDSQVG